VYGRRTADRYNYGEQENGSSRLGEQLRTRLGEPEVSAALVLRKPALLDRAIEPGLVFRRRAFQLKEKRPIERPDCSS